MTASMLEKTSISGTRWISVHGEKVLLAETPQALYQAAGYLKFICASETPPSAVVFRGQRTLHGSLLPTLFRGCRTQAAIQRREVLMRATLRVLESGSAMWDKVEVRAREPLLQHYGMRTGWVDAVDHMSTSLWFACTRFRETRGLGQVRMRCPEDEPEKDRLALVLLLRVPSWGQHGKSHGHAQDAETEILDLRVGVPSLYLRPHMQSAVAVRSTLRPSGVPQPDLQSRVVGTLAVDLTKALSWLGTGELATPAAFFPSPLDDFGYSDLLRMGGALDTHDPKELLGRITSYGL